VEKDLGWPSPWRSQKILQQLLEWKRPPERNASRCCGSTSRTITYKTQKTSNTSSQTKRWARFLETRESEHLVWPSFWVPTYHQSNYLWDWEKYNNLQGDNATLPRISISKQVQIWRKKKINYHVIRYSLCIDHFWRQHWNFTFNILIVVMWRNIKYYYIVTADNSKNVIFPNIFLPVTQNFRHWHIPRCCCIFFPYIIIYERIFWRLKTL